MNTCVQWATILSPIIAVIIAVIAGYLNSKSTHKHISALEDSTAKQIESIKRLAKLQTEIATIQMDKELWELRFLIEENSSKIIDAHKEDNVFLYHQHDAALEKIQKKKEKEKSLSYKQDFYQKQIDNLKGHIKRFEQVKKELKLL